MKNILDLKCIQCVFNKITLSSTSKMRIENDDIKMILNISSGNIIILMGGLKHKQ